MKLKKQIFTIFISIFLLNLFMFVSFSGYYSSGSLGQSYGSGEYSLGIVWGVLSDFIKSFENENFLAALYYILSYVFLVLMYSGIYNFIRFGKSASSYSYDSHLNKSRKLILVGIHIISFISVSSLLLTIGYLNIVDLYKSTIGFFLLVIFLVFILRYVWLKFENDRNIRFFLTATIFWLFMVTLINTNFLPEYKGLFYFLAGLFQFILIVSFITLFFGFWKGKDISKLPKSVSSAVFTKKEVDDRFNEVNQKIDDLVDQLKAAGLLGP